MSSKQPKRFVVSNLGFAFAVHDTQVRQEYAFEAGKDAKHASNNALNTERVEICPTREIAQQIADRLNAQFERGQGERKGA